MAEPRLYASFSVKQRYADVIGTGGDDSINLVGVAVQEMHHLARVNELLGQLRAPPNLVRQDFPYETTSTRPGDQLLTSDPDDLRSLVAERGIPVTVVPV